MRGAPHVFAFGFHLVAFRRHPSANIGGRRALCQSSAQDIENDRVGIEFASTGAATRSREDKSNLEIADLPWAGKNQRIRGGVLLFN